MVYAAWEFGRREAKEGRHDLKTSSNGRSNLQTILKGRIDLKKNLREGTILREGRHDLERRKARSTEREGANLRGKARPSREDIGGKAQPEKGRQDLKKILEGRYVRETGSTKNSQTNFGSAKLSMAWELSHSSAD